MLAAQHARPPQSTPARPGISKPHQQVLDQRGALRQRSQQQDTVGQGLGAGQPDCARNVLHGLQDQLLDCTPTIKKYVSSVMKVSRPIVLAM